ncbi:nucleotide exchange factor GrpE [Candidatus Woesearchaeota archaeon]|nr:MAG: nucleotide exchange factor GrpE [Candidatus Woesearchaeota archaeon]
MEDAKTKIKKDVKKTKKELKQESTEDKAKEYLNQLQRLQAEFINYRQRVEKERLELIKYAKEELILKLLDVMDNFERAIDAMKNAKDVKSCMQGVDMIFEQFRKVLENEGLQAINAKGEMFDPYLHEALAKEESDQDENVIIDEFQKGYKLKDKVIRPAKVKVSGGKKNE